MHPCTCDVNMHRCIYADCCNSAFCRANDIACPLGNRLGWQGVLGTRYGDVMIERECEDVYGSAQFRIEDRPSLGEIMRDTMGMWPGYSDQIDKELTTVRSGLHWQALVRSDVPSCRARWLWSRELARWWLRRYQGIRRDHAVINRLAAAILTPRELFLPAAHDCLWCVHNLAGLFFAPEALVLLRIGEVGGGPVALFDPEHHVIMLRGDLRRFHGRSRIVRFADDTRCGKIAI